jgi:DNA repair exonuclease SbcCD ATPase subunit
MRKVDMKKVVLALGHNTDDMGTPAETSDLQQKFLPLKKEVETLKKEISMKDEANAKKDEEIKVLRSDLQNCRDQLLSNAAIGVQHGDALHLKREVDALKKQITDLRKESEIKNLEIETKNVEIETLKQECEVLKLEKAVAIEKCSVEMERLKSEINTVDLTNAPIDEKAVEIEKCSVEVDELKSKIHTVDLTDAQIEPKSKGNVLDLTDNTDQHGVYFQLKGLHYIVEDVAGDGSCLFHSLAKITLVPFSTGHDVREAIVSYVVKGEAGGIIAKDDELKTL